MMNSSSVILGCRTGLALLAQPLIAVRLTLGDLHGEVTPDD